MSIILFIIILTILVLVHELGHFLAAKKSGVRVDEFGIGFPPRLWKKKVGETVYSLNLFPVGGFVKIFGEKFDEESAKGHDSKRSLLHKSRFVQAWVISAGVIFNLLFAWIVVSVGFMTGMPFSADGETYGAEVKNAALVITGVKPHSPAESVGLKGGDRIIALYSGKDSLEKPHTTMAQKFIDAHSVLTLTYMRGTEIKTVVVHPENGIISGRHAIGISMDMIGTTTLPIHRAFYAGFISTMSLTKDTITGLLGFFKQIFIGKADFSEVTGPVGIVSIVSDASVLGLTHILLLMALISVNLAVINLLPFPALDGGRLLFVIIEAIKGSPIKPIIVNTANSIGFLLLIILMVVVTYHDIVRLLHR